MKTGLIISVSLATLFIMGCASVKLQVNNKYQLRSFSTKQLTTHPLNATLLVTPPESASAYQTNQMLYIDKPFQLTPFVKNAWTAPPADMLYPLIVQSLQRTGYFSAVATGSYSEGAIYRIDTMLINLDQNFLTKPSTLEFSAKVVLTRVEDNRVLASRIFSQRVECQNDNPYGGVMAANKAVGLFTSQVVEFVIGHITKSKGD